jgi:hypothetical protein
VCWTVLLSIGDVVILVLGGGCRLSTAVIDEDDGLSGLRVEYMDSDVGHSG